jgi:hypothetical protein
MREAEPRPNDKSRFSLWPVRRKALPGKEKRLLNEAVTRESKSHAKITQSARRGPAFFTGKVAWHRVHYSALSAFIKRFQFRLVSGSGCMPSVSSLSYNGKRQLRNQGEKKSAWAGRGW